MRGSAEETPPRGKAETQQRFRQEEAAYWQQRDELLKLYPGKWVAIVGGQVVAVGEQMIKLKLRSESHVRNHNREPSNVQ